MTRNCTASGVDEHGTWACDRSIERYISKRICNAHYRQQGRGKAFTRVQTTRGRKSRVRRHDPQDMFGNGVPEGHQGCTTCDEVKPLTEFYPHKRDGHTQSCKECISKRNTDNRYGDGATEWKQQQLEKNNGKCALCLRSDPGTASGWMIDHSHNYALNDPAGRRGVLCHFCNILLGYIETNELDLDTIHARYKAYLRRA